MSVYNFSIKLKSMQNCNDYDDDEDDEDDNADDDDVVEKVNGEQNIQCYLFPSVNLLLSH